MSVVHYLQYVKRLFAACKYSIRFYSLVLRWNRHDKLKERKRTLNSCCLFLTVCVCACIPQFAGSSTVQFPPRAALRGWCQKVSPSQVSLGTYSHYRHFFLSLSLSFFLSPSLSRTHSHACTQYYPHHKLMSHYIVISVVFAPPCLSTICHTLHMVMTHKLKSCCRFQREGFHACMHTNTHTLHAHTLLCRFAFCVYIVLTEGFCLCFFLFCFCVLLTSHSFPLVKRRQTLNPSWYPLWILITMLFPAGGPQKDHVI